MRRAQNLVIVALLALSPVMSPRPARAQACESARPTDAAGATGLSYGSAEAAYFDSPSGRARVHYALSGSHAPPSASTLEPAVPDAAVIAARAADDALDKFAELKYRAPLSDAASPCASNGDGDAIDIYLVHFAAADGQAVLDHCEPGPPMRCAGFVLVENDFKGGGYASAEEGLRTVVPHELFHLVQDAYDANVERWWAEGSAQWAAKQVYPELRDLERFLPAYFKSPWRPLNVPPNGVITDFLYATAIWPVFLEERFDAELVREVYDAFDDSSDGVLVPTGAVLEGHGSSLAAEFLRFATFNAATGRRAPTEGGYRHAADYPEVALQALAATPGDLAGDVASGLGAFYYSLSSPSPLTLSLESDPSRVAGMLVPLLDGKLEVADAQPLPATLEGDGVVVVAGQSLLRSDAPFTLKATAGTEADGPESSGCSVSRGADTSRDKVSLWLAVVVGLAGAGRASKRNRKADA